MISFRQHLVSLIAVFLALAVGVVLGGGPLSDVGRDDRPAAATAREHRSDARSAAYGDDFAAAAAAKLYGDGLKGHPVSILTLPGADGDDVSALAAQIEDAGGEVAGTYQAEPALVDAHQKSLVDTLGSQLMTQLGHGAVSHDATTYERIGQLVALGIAGDKLARSDADAVRQSLSGAELMSSPDTAGRGQVVLVVLGDSGDTDDSADPVDPAVLSGLTAGMAATASAVVVAGDTASATETGDLTALRAEQADGGAGDAAEEVATVDGVDTTLGQVSSVLALIRSLSTPGGSFGASGSDGAVPLT